MTSIVAYGTGLVILAAAFTRTRALRANPAPALRALCLALWCLSLAFLLQADDTVTLAGHVTGIPGITRWAGSSLTLAAACALFLMLAHLTRRRGAPEPRTRTRVAVMLAAVTAMGVLTITSQHAGSAGFGTGKPARPASLAYLLIYLSYLGAALVSNLTMALRYAPCTAARYLRAGLRLMATGSVTGLAYVAGEAALAASRWLGLQPPGGAPALANLAACAAGLQIAAGGTAGAWGPPLGARARRWRQSRDYHALQPLWRDLCEAVPDIALTPDTGTSESGIGYRLYRRVIEILDGELAVRAYRDPVAIAHAAEQARQCGLRGRKLTAIIEAAAIASAIAAKAAGRPPGDSSGMPVGEPRNDLADEIGTLTQVSRAYTRSPIVRRVRSGDGNSESGARMTLGATRRRLASVLTKASRPRSSLPRHSQGHRMARHASQRMRGSAHQESVTAARAAAGTSGRAW